MTIIRERQIQEYGEMKGGGCYSPCSDCCRGVTAHTEEWTWAFCAIKYTEVRQQPYVQNLDIDPWHELCKGRSLPLVTMAKVRQGTTPVHGKHGEVFDPREDFQNCPSERNIQSHTLFCVFTGCSLCLLFALIVRATIWIWCASCHPS